MSRFYFDINDGSNFRPDFEGVDCNSLEEIREEALRLMPDYSYFGGMSSESCVFSVFVRDNLGRCVVVNSVSIAELWATDQLEWVKVNLQDRSNTNKT